MNKSYMIMEKETMYKQIHYTWKELRHSSLWIRIGYIKFLMKQIMKKPTIPLVNQFISRTYTKQQMIYERINHT